MTVDKKTTFGKLLNVSSLFGKILSEALKHQLNTKMNKLRFSNNQYILIKLKFNAEEYHIKW